MCIYTVHKHVSYLKVWVASSVALSSQPPLQHVLCVVFADKNLLAPLSSRSWSYLDDADMPSSGCKIQATAVEAVCEQEQCVVVVGRKQHLQTWVCVCGNVCVNEDLCVWCLIDMCFVLCIQYVHVCMNIYKYLEQKIYVQIDVYIQIYTHVYVHVYKHICIHIEQTQSST